MFFEFVAKLIPIYLLIGAGFVMGKRLPVRRDTISSLLIYLIAPVVIFNSVYTTELSKQTIILPAVFFLMCSGMALLAYWGNRGVKSAKLRGVLGFAGGSGNTGYFGIPVALALFGEDAVGLVVLCVFGFLVYETTLGFILISRGTHTVTESLQKLLRLPIVYTFLLGIVAQATNFNMGQVYQDFVPNFRGAYVLLGSLLIGVALSELTRAHAELSTVVRSFLVRFVAWPAMMIGFILLDKAYFGLFEGRTDIYQVMFLMSIVPIAANTVAYATFMKAEPERAAFIVFSSTIFAIGFIPVMTSFVLPHLI
jgi:predicted permease